MSQLTLAEFIAYLSDDEPAAQPLSPDSAPVGLVDGGDPWADISDSQLITSHGDPWEMDGPCLSDSQLITADTDPWEMDGPCLSDSQLITAEADPWEMDLSDRDLIAADKKKMPACPETVGDFLALGMNRPQADLWAHLVDVLSLNRPCPMPIMDVLLRAPGYRDRMMIMTFAYVNGCDGDLIIAWYALCGRFIDKPCRLKHLENLRRDIHVKTPNTCDRWYAYNMYHERWEYLNGEEKIF